MVEEVLRRFNPWWSKEYEAPGIIRESYLDEITNLLRHERFIILFGLRRVGKTTIMRQYIARTLQHMKPEQIVFASIDHPELEHIPLYELLREFRRLHGLKSTEDVLLFLDEVQSRPDFEKELKAIYDIEEHVKIIASGSSSLVIKHKSSHLIGRYRHMQVRPLTFREYLIFKGTTPDSSEPQVMEKLVDDYLHDGGIPEYVLTLDPGYLSEMVTNIIYRDICGTYGVKDPKLLKDLYFLMIERVGKKISYSKLARLVGIGNDAVKRYVSYFEDAFLIHTIEQKGTQNERKYGPKKCYAPDNGICSVFSESIGTGALAENCVYLELKKSCEPVYVDRNNLEVDFLCGKDAYEVKYKDNLGENDVKGLTAIAQKGLKNKWLITKSVHTTQGDIVTIPLWKFLLKP